MAPKKDVETNVTPPAQSVPPPVTEPGTSAEGVDSPALPETEFTDPDPSGASDDEGQRYDGGEVPRTHSGSTFEE